MRKIGFVLAVFGTVLLGALSVQPTHAQTRVFVAAQGSDSNLCTFALPCRTFQHAHDTVAAGGEIDVLDPAGYGAVTITKSISIQGHGFSGITQAGAGANAITINAAINDVINVSGVVLDGFGSGNAGIVFMSGASLKIQESTIRNFTAKGIDFAPKSQGQLVMERTVISDLVSPAVAVNVAPQQGSQLSGPTTAVLDHVLLSRGVVGLNGDKSASFAPLNITITDSVVSNYSSAGLFITGTGTGALQVMIRNCTIINNNSGIVADGNDADISLAGSTVMFNRTGLTVSAGEINSYGNNNIHDNTTNGVPSGSLLSE